MKENWSQKIKMNVSGVAVMPERAGYFKLYYLNPSTRRYKLFYTGTAQNLKKELAAHLPWREQNPTLAHYLLRYRCMFQIAQAEQESEVDSVRPIKSVLPKLFRFFVPAQVQKVTY